MTKEKNKLLTLFPLVLAIIVIGSLIFVLKAKSSNQPKTVKDDQVSQASEENQGEPKLEYNKEEFKFGTISMKKGNVKHLFPIKNTGSGNLKISKMATSCMCTTAQLIVGEKKSPLVQMHDGAAAWTEELKPGQEGQIEVVFDPAAHGPEGVGEIMRVISFESNDPANKKVELHFSANVVR